MPAIDFVITNNRHHVRIMRPVIETLTTERDCRCRVLSLCQFRGFPAATENFDSSGEVEVVEVVKRNVRPSPSIGRQSAAGRQAQYAREAARAASWHLILKPGLQKLFSASPDLVVFANDAAFPNDRIVRLWRRREKPFVLVQEGIRFALPGSRERDDYGKNGATAIAAWGETSAEFFQARGVDREKIFLTGTPQYDNLTVNEWHAPAERLTREKNLPRKNLLLISNPIDDQGFCTTEEKWRLLRRFIEGLAPLFADDEFGLIVKLHGRESADELRARLEGLPFAERVIIFNQTPLYALFSLAAAAVVLASTAGLEALMFNLPLGVLEIPGHGFAHDYVSREAARGLTWSAPMAAQVSELLDPPPERQRKVADYLARSLATRTGATGRVAEVIMRAARDNV